MSSLMETKSLFDTKVGSLWQLSDIMETCYMWLKNRCSTVFYTSFKFHSNSFTIRRSKKIELQLLPISEMGNLYMLTLTFDDWPFGMTVTRHFRPKPGHSNSRVYCKQIDIILKVRFNEWWSWFIKTSFCLRYLSRQNWLLGCWTSWICSYHLFCLRRIAFE